METKYKLLLGTIIFSIFVLLGVILYFQNNINQKQKEIDHNIIEFQKLQDGIVRLENKYVNDSKDLEAILKELGTNVDVIKNDLNEQGAQLEAVAVVVGETHGYSNQNISSDFQKPIDTNSNSSDTVHPINSNNNSNNSNNTLCLNQFGYCENIQGLNLFEHTDDDKIPFGNVTFNATSDKPWSLNVLPRKYYSILSFGKDNDGRTIAHSQMLVESDGKKYMLGINEAYYREVYEPARFYWWNPRLAGGLGFGASTSGKLSSMLSLQFYLSSYAFNKARPSWMFFGVGAGYDLQTKSLVGTISPAMYNVLPNSNLIQNVYVGPTFGVGTDGIRLNGTINIVF